MSFRTPLHYFCTHFLLYLYKPPRACCEEHPLSVMVPPPWFTAGIVCLWWWAVLKMLFLPLYSFDWWRARTAVVRSLSPLRKPWTPSAVGTCLLSLTTCSRRSYTCGIFVPFPHGGCNSRGCSKTFFSICPLIYGIQQPFLRVGWSVLDGVIVEVTLINQRLELPSAVFVLQLVTHSLHKL